MIQNLVKEILKLRLPNIVLTRNKPMTIVDHILEHWNWQKLTIKIFIIDHIFNKYKKI